MKREWKRPITPNELHEVAELLVRRGPWGVPREELARKVAGDRHAREIIAEIRRRGILPVVVTPGPDGREVYRVAQDREELEEFILQERSRLARIYESIQGLKRAWEHWAATGRPRYEQERIL